MGDVGDSGRMRVSGPGQKARANWSAMGDSGSGVRSYLARSDRAAICTMSGLSAGRRLAEKMADTASALVASAPRP